MKENKCEICKSYIDDFDEYADQDSNICEKCQVSIFQILDIMETYVYNDVPPKWIVALVKEFSWIYQKNPRTMGYFNVVLEVVEEFLFESMPKIPIEEIIELHASLVPNNKIISLLTESMIIESDSKFVYPGDLVKKLQQIRWEGYELSSRQLENKFLELHGIITIAITRSMIKNGDQIPKQVLALFNLLSNQILINGDDEIEPVIPGYSFELAFLTLMPARQTSKMKRHLIGLADGHAKIIKDIDDEGAIHLKDSTVIYLDEMRQRWRNRERERIRI